jgi:hypothetical protein
VVETFSITQKPSVTLCHRKELEAVAPKLEIRNFGQGHLRNEVEVIGLVVTD